MINPEENKISQEIIRAVLKIVADETQKNLTTYGVISRLEDTIKYLQYNAGLTDPENYLPK